ncbi:MAG: LexA family transcriptional regulator [Cyclobacteriaceae bacterium]|nr:LexA family transcriptional regulator [Cyclobacteriaceae bacterium]
MSIIADNIKTLRKKLGMTQGTLAEAMGIKRSLIGAYEEGRAEPRLNNLVKLAEVFQTSIDNLVQVDMSGPDGGKSQSALTRAGGERLRILSVAVDDQGEDLVPLVPQKAAAGYLSGYADGEYLQELPQFKLPNLPKGGTHRAFEIVGDSMLPMPSGTIVVGRYVEDWRDIKSGDTYILLTNSEGVVYKRVFNYIDESQKLFLVSDNRSYTPYEMSIDDVLEVWAAKAFISVTFPDPSADPQWSLEKLTSMVLELQQEVTKLKN